jgi:nucleobase:cation symporter-1, NCS1 family
MLGFFFAFLCTIPFLFIHTSKITHLFSVKSIIMPAAGLGLVIWATTKNGGVSSQGLVDPSARTSTAVFAWGIIAQFNAVMGSNSALLVTVPDLARYSRTKNAQLWGQLISLPVGQTLCAAFGIISTVSCLPASVI